MRLEYGRRWRTRVHQRNRELEGVPLDRVVDDRELSCRGVHYWRIYRGNEIYETHCLHREYSLRVEIRRDKGFVD